MAATDVFSVYGGFGGGAVAQGIASQSAWNTILEHSQANPTQPNNHCVTPFFIAFGPRP
jgi:hypothetical protein